MISMKNAILSLGLVSSFVTLASAAPYEEAQQALVDECVSQTSDPTRVWEHEVCILAAVGQNVRTRPIAFFLYENFGGEDAPADVDVQRASDQVLGQLAYGQIGADITMQSWVDAFYGTLAELGGPYPDDSSLVLSQYGNVASWTSECDGIPPFNFADYLQYSSTVQGGTGCSGIMDVAAAEVTIPAFAQPTASA